MGHIRTAKPNSQYLLHLFDNFCTYDHNQSYNTFIHPKFVWKYFCLFVMFWELFAVLVYRSSLKEERPGLLSAVTQLVQQAAPNLANYSSFISPVSDDASIR